MVAGKRRYNYFAGTLKCRARAENAAKNLAALRLFATDLFKLKKVEKGQNFPFMPAAYVRLAQRVLTWCVKHERPADGLNVSALIAPQNRLVLGNIIDYPPDGAPFAEAPAAFYRSKQGQSGLVRRRVLFRRCRPFLLGGSMFKNITAIQQRDTCLAISFLLLLIWLFTKTVLFVYLAMALMLLGMLWPSSMRPLAFAWFGLATVLGHIVSSVLLTIIWAVLVLPVGFVRRAMGRDSLRLKEWHKGQGSCFVVRDHTYTANDLKNPY